VNQRETSRIECGAETATFSGICLQLLFIKNMPHILYEKTGEVFESKKSGHYMDEQVSAKESPF
jgi:hypothetical protein